MLVVQTGPEGMIYLLGCHTAQPRWKSLFWEAGMEAFFQFKPEILEESVHGRPALYPFRFATGVCSSRVHVFRGLKNRKKAYSFVRPWSFKDEWCRTTGYRGRCHVPFSSWLSKVGALSLFTAQSQTHSQWVLELRQGCPLSPSLFLTFMDRISRHRQREEKVQFENRIVLLLLHIITWQSFYSVTTRIKGFFCVTKMSLLNNVAQHQREHGGMLTLHCVKAGHLRRFRHLIGMPSGPLSLGGFPGTSNWEETGRRPRSHCWDCVSCGLGCLRIPQVELMCTAWETREEM